VIAGLTRGELLPRPISRASVKGRRTYWSDKGDECDICNGTAGKIRDEVFFALLVVLIHDDDLNERLQRPKWSGQGTVRAIGVQPWSELL
jgi:hypothetical protein